MKKKYIMVLVGQSILIFLMLIFSFFQKAEADRARELADQQRKQAVEMEKNWVEMRIKYEELVREKGH